jgi:hypothetical protein
VTLLLLAPVTVALMVLVCPPVSDAEVGDTVMVIGVRDIFAVADSEVFAALTAVTVMVWADATVAGAV